MVMSHRLLPLYLLSAVSILPLSGMSDGAVAAQPKTLARQAFMIALPAKKVLLAKRSTRPMAPSSMAKLMTVLLVLEALEAGKVSLAQPIKISRTATRTRGSRLGLKPGEAVTLETLLRGTIVASGNDSAIALAEAISGTETAFARRMTARAKEIGLKNSRFRNATGFSRRGQRMTARDVATLSAYLIERYPLFYAYFALRSVSHGGKAFANRNPVLGAVDGADGLKTGQTRAGGYGLAASARRGDTRLILVINGLKSAKARRDEAIRLLEWGFAQMAPKAGKP